MVVRAPETATPAGNPPVGASLLVFIGLCAGLALLYGAMVASAPAGADLATGPPFRTMWEWGAKVDPLVAAGEWERVVVGAWIHADLSHLVTNLLWTLLFGVAAGALSSPRLALSAWVLAGAGGQLASFAVRAGTSVGASGAVYGVAGLMAALVWRRRGELVPSLRGKAVLTTGALVVALLIAPLSFDGVDHAAHFGGMAVGVGVGLGVRSPRAARVVTWAAALLAIAAVSWRVARVL